MTATVRSAAASPPSPVADIWLWGNSVRILAFGKPYDWSLRPYTATAALQELETLAPSLYLPKIAEEYGLGKMLYAPSPREFNAKTCTEAEAMRTRVTLESKLFHNTVTLFRGANADGMVPSKGHVYANSPSGCPNIVARDSVSEVVGFAHAGMRSLIDEGRLKGEGPRQYESVVMSLLDAMRARGVQSFAQVEVMIVFPIDPRDFTYLWDHPIFGTLNQKRTEDLVERWGESAIYGYAKHSSRRLGRPDLSAIIRSQFVSMGVPHTQINVMDSPSKRVMHDTRQGGNTMVRNLVLMQHRHT